MPTRDTAPVGAPCWVDLMTSDTDRSRTFYCELFGWEAQAPAAEFGGYLNFTKDGIQVAGCMASQPGADPSDVWSVYLASQDATKTVEIAVTSGGQVHVQPMAVGDLGTMAFLADSTGAGVGVWQPGEHSGFGVLGEPGTPGWFELHTRDYEAAVEFYRSVFGWQTHVVSDTPEFRYTTLVDPDGGAGSDSWLAGIMDSAGHLAEGAPACWSVYWGVEDTDATLAKVLQLGGSIVMPAEDTPYGRLAVAVDSTGAQFSLVGPNVATPATSS